MIGKSIAVTSKEGVTLFSTEPRDLENVLLNIGHKLLHMTQRPRECVEKYHASHWLYIGQPMNNPS